MTKLTVKRTGGTEYGRHVKALICGDPGAGKTLVSSTWPNPLYASAEGGLMSVADRQVPFVPVKTSDELNQVMQSLNQNADVRRQMLGFETDTVVVDTIDEILRILTKERIAERRIEGLQQQDWGWLGDQMRGIIRGFRNLEMNVIFTCHVKESVDQESGRVYIKPQLQGAIQDEISAYFDLAVLLRAHPKNEIVDGQTVRRIVRVMQTYPDAAHPWIKDRSGKLPMELELNFEDDGKRIAEFIFGTELPDSTEQDVETPSPTQTASTIVPPPQAPPTKAKGTTKKAPPKKSGDQQLPDPPADETAAPPAGAAAPAAAPPATEAPEAEAPEVPVEPETAPEPAAQQAPVPAPAAAPAAEETAAAPAAEETVPSDGTQTAAPETTEEESAQDPCETCGKQIEQRQQGDLSYIRFQKRMCRGCFADARKAR